MTDASTTHPSPRRLAEYGQGKLPADQMVAVHDHLSRCAECRRQVEGRQPDDVPPELAGSSKFQVLGKVGQGGMGAVYKARHNFLGELVAIKVMSAAAVGNPEARARFLREMQAAGKLKHPNIVRALDA